MRCMGRILVSVAAAIAGAVAFGCVPSVGGSSARAQTGSPPAGSLLGTAHPAPEQPAKPPSAAPRQPVHQEGHVSKAATPVVSAHGPNRPHKPQTAAPPSAPAKSAPVE